MAEIILNSDKYLGQFCKVYFDGELQKLCLEAAVSPQSFAAPTGGALLLAVVEDGRAVSAMGRWLADGEIDRDGLICRWLSGLVRIELDNDINCLHCSAKSSVAYNPAIEKVWCRQCGADALQEPE